MGYFDDLYAGFLGRYSPIWDEIEANIEDVEYIDLDTESPDHSAKAFPNSISDEKPISVAIDYADTDNK